MRPILILGAGACGLLTAVKLQQAGHSDLLLLEKADRLGGTWRDNVYPGLTCDVPSYLYEFSFAPHDWSRTYAGQAEILVYLEGVARRHGLYEKIRFGAEVVEARWADGRWVVELKSGERLEAPILFHAPGALGRPHIPNLPGLGSFRGEQFHSACWPADYDARGRRVAVVGSAASAVQLVPPVAERAARVHLFQRTPSWVLPKFDRPYASWEKALLRRSPGKLYRAWLLARQELAFAVFREGSLAGRLTERWALRWMRSQIQDPALRRALTPDYPIGCKRMLLSSDFYPTLTRPHVELVTRPIERIAPEGVQTTDGCHRPVDTLILATGFEVHSAPIPVYGRSGPLPPRAYRGVTVAGFPNLFLLLGPNTGLGHSSVWLMAEAQADFAVRALAEMRRRGTSCIEVRPEAMEAYNRALPVRFQGTVWAAGCRSWYKRDGEILVLYPSSVRAYRRELAQADWGSYTFA